MSWRDEEERKNGGWTIWKEIVGTAIGIMPGLIAIGGGMLSWGWDLQKAVVQDTQRIVALELQRNEITAQLNKIGDKIDILAQTVATDNALQRGR